MRLIDAAALYEQTAEWAAKALEQVERYRGWKTMDGLDYKQWKHWNAVLNERLAFKFDVADAPTVEAEPVKHGRWIWDDEGYHCSECFFHAYGNSLECLNGTYKYCPNCGARMDGENDE